MFSRKLKVITQLVAIGSVMAMFAVSAFGQELKNVTRPRTVSKATSLRPIPPGQEVEINGNITRIDQRSFSVCDMAGAETVVLLTGSTKITTHRRGIFRGPKTYDASTFSPGLKVVIKGRGNEAGQLVAKWVRFHDSDFRAQTQVDTRAIPLEMEQQRQADQLDEASIVATTARREAQTAQQNAEIAQATADLARSDANTAQITAVSAHDKIAALDDFEVVETRFISFEVNSAELSPEAMVKLDALAARALNTRGYAIEISAFASSDGGSEFNHRLTQRRAEAVMDYLVGRKGVPARRLIVPFSGGDMNPIADNGTKEGRAINRRAEVRMLVSKGLAAKEEIVRSTK